MPEISLTDFVDFVAKSGTPKLTHVRQIKSRGDYNPAEDFWRLLRTGIVKHHRTNEKDKKKLDAIIKDLTDSKKSGNYPNAIKQYKSFLGRKKIKWFKPPKNTWVFGDLELRVNPELGLVINGQRHIVKLYFKKMKLTKSKADLILLLLQDGLPTAKLGDEYSILDVQNKKLFSSNAPDPTFLPLLQGEAMNFATIWNQLDTGTGG